MMNTFRLALTGVAATLALSLPHTAQATVKTYQAPADSLSLKSSNLPGYERASAICHTCHSVEYILYQPASAARPYWDAMVHRMKNVFNAPVKEADIPEIVDYLVKTYGNEQPK